jgi:hypothetical protein
MKNQPTVFLSLKIFTPRVLTVGNFTEAQFKTTTITSLTQ